jgi:hypothetical protein
MSRAWIITKDYIAEDPGVAYPGSPGLPTDVGTIGPRDASDADIAALKAGKGHAFALYDDDHNLYYRGRAIWSEDDEEEGPYGPLGDFGGPNAGCVLITYAGHPEYDCG